MKNQNGTPMMRTGYLRCLGTLTLTAIVVALIIWSVSIYRSSLKSYLQTTDQCLSFAVETEFNMRKVTFGNQFRHLFEPEQDTSTYITKTVRLEDSVMDIRIDRDDSTAFIKLRQFIFGSVSHVNTGRVDSIFKQCMSDNFLPVKASYVEYLDLNKNTVLARSVPEEVMPKYNIVSNINMLDILKTIGVRVYVEASTATILKPMMFQFVALIVLTVIALISTFLLIRNILHLRKEGFLILRKIAHGLDRNATKTAVRMKIATDDLLKLRKTTEQDEMFEQLYDQLHNSDSAAGRLWRYLDNEDGKIEFHKFPIKIKPVFDELKAQFERTEHKKVSVSVRCDDHIMLNTDELYFNCIIEELMRNAVNFSDGPVHIDIRVRQMENKVVIFVRDNGWGIPKEELEAVFKFSHRIDTHVSKLKDDHGIGVGLSFVESFASSLGGSVTVISAEGDFTIFELVFPLTPEDLGMIQSMRPMFRFDPEDETT